MFDAIVRAPDGVAFVFRGDVFWEFDETKGGIHWNRPLKFGDFWPGLPANMDAAYRGRGKRSDKLYFFKGRHYWRYTWAPNTGRTQYATLDAGYPKTIEGAFKGYWSNGIDAFLDFGDHQRYAFRRDQIRVYDAKTDKLTHRFSPITDLFAGVFSDPDDVPHELSAVFGGQKVISGKKEDAVYFLHFDEQTVHTNPSKLLNKTVQYEVIWGKPEATRRSDLSSEPEWSKASTVLPRDRALALASFRNDSAKGAFAAFTRQQIADQLERRLMYPKMVRQSSVGFCGPASIVYWMAKTQPDLYIQIVTDLFNEGKFRGHGEQFNPSADFLNATSELPRFGGNRIAEIDWMVMGAMRDVSGGFKIDGDGDDVTGTRKGILKTWCKEILGYTDVGFEPSRIVGEHKALEHADRACNSLRILRNGDIAQGLGILQVHSRILKDAVEKKAKKDDSDTAFLKALGEELVGDHWVVFEGDSASDPGKKAKSNDGHFTFDVYSWGRIIRVDVDEKTFRDNMFGAIWAK